MISEVRYLLFNEHEILRALIEYKKPRNQALPTGTIADFKIHRKQPIICTLSIHEDEGGKHAEIIFTNDIVRAALVSYCIFKKVPLPAKAEKDLRPCAVRRSDACAQAANHLCSRRERSRPRPTRV